MHREVGRAKDLSAPLYDIQFNIAILFTFQSLKQCIPFRFSG